MEYILKEIGKRVVKKGDCHIWQGVMHANKPILSVRGSTFNVRSFVWGGEELVGSLHPTCKTPGCINPKHLAIGRERKENNWNLPEHESAVSVFKNYTLAVKQWRGIRSKKEYSSASAKRSLKLYCLKQLGME